MKKTPLLSLIAIFSIINLTAQSLTDIQKKGLSPISPTAFQFLKFGEIPLNEYTGSPTIEIPLFDVDVRGFSLPIKLQYHSKGIRVSEEADWVGLGWDLSFGSVTQILNDKDDLLLPFTRNYMPYSSGISTIVNVSKNNLNPLSMSIDNTATTHAGDNTYSFSTYQYGWNINGGGYSSTDLIDFDNLNSTDFEKDIFVANVLGERIYILMKINSNVTSVNSSNTKYIVLNKKGYNVSCILNKAGDTYIWKIITPSGIICYFEERNRCDNGSGSYTDAFNKIFDDNHTLLGSPTSQSFVFTSSGSRNSSIWQISKIISLYGDTILFNYSDKKPLLSSIVSTQWKVGNGINVMSNYVVDPNSPGDYNSNQGPFNTPPTYMTGQTDGTNYTINHINITKLSYYQERSYLKSITYNHNTASFYTSSRNDWANAQKLDSIVVTNSQLQKIKSIQLNYDYYQSNYSGRGFNINGSSNEMINRLRLNSILTQKTEKYLFTYNATQLPPKNSFGVDYWGYYNGQINNCTSLPRVADFNYSSYDQTFNSILSNNTAIKYAVSDFCKAGVLEGIQYPTGAYSRFYYSLNQFDNFKVPNDPAANITNSYCGNGLRVDSIINYTADNYIVTKKYYQYEQGKLQTPLSFFCTSPENYCIQNPISGVVHFRNYSASVFNTFGSSYYTPNPIGDGSGVGYNKVTSWFINNKTKVADSGKTIHYYTNTPDIVCEMDDRFNQLVPAYHKGLENGTLLNEEVFDNSNKKISTTRYNYIYKYDIPIEYNGKANYLGMWGVNTTFKRMLIAYYPIFKPENRLKSKIKVDYINNDSVEIREDYFYNQSLNEEYNILRSKSTNCSNSSQQKEDTYFYPFDLKDDATLDQKQRGIMQKLFMQNRLNEKVKITQSTYTCGQGSQKKQYYEYDDVTCLPNIVKTSIGYYNPLETELTFSYNSKKNIIEKRSKDNIPTAYLWGYKGQYLIAEVKNISYSEMEAKLGGTNQVQSLSETMIPDMSKVEQLRQELPNSEVTTYTYIPLVGMATKTDSRGVKTSFNYDSFNRLQSIKDNNGKKLNEYQYHYYNQQ